MRVTMPGILKAGGSQFARCMRGRGSNYSSQQDDAIFYKICKVNLTKSKLYITFVAVNFTSCQKSFTYGTWK